MNSNKSTIVIEDFFRLLLDALIYYSPQFLNSQITSPILSASIAALTLQQEPPLTTTLHFLRDFLSYGTSHPNSSPFPSHESPNSYIPGSSTSGPQNPPELQNVVKSLILQQGEALVTRVLTGMMFTFPRDCHQDASGIILVLFELFPAQTARWVQITIAMLPAGSLKSEEGEKLMRSISEKLGGAGSGGGDLRKVRVLLQDFTNAYRRRNVAPREGLGRLEATRFRFSG